MNFWRLLAGAMMIMATLNAAAATIADRLAQYGVAARARLAPHFAKQNIAYPPRELVFVGLKAEKSLQVYAKSGTNGFVFICAYPIVAASGVAGPKLREGDRQVPEGIYGIELLNPNSSYHLSLRVNYPNAFDRAQAAREHRTHLGGDIMIHGKDVSIGCLAMGDAAAEELFVLAADAGIKNITVILAPVDFRLGKSVSGAAQLPEWTATLYAEIKSRLSELPLPKAKGAPR
jgi:murein L,D-transpeptidase YafK